MLNANVGAISDIHSKGWSSAACLTFTISRLPSEYEDVAAPGCHGMIESHGAPEMCCIELFPLKIGRREPIEVTRVPYTVQHAHTRVRPQVT